MKNYLSILIFFLFTGLSQANCNFKTGDYLEELSNPKSITLIEIEVAKSSKYFQNAFKIISSRSKNIPTDLRKKFKAKLKIFYTFGNCEFEAKIRQSGDWKDHIDFKPQGKLIRSLDVKLTNGNILNAISFKLLLPKTRNGANEILASLILRKNGFISPETFEVSTLINGIKSNMIFQENSRKELLERSQRREGPIFEGDESLIWSKDYNNFELEQLALSRLVNRNWFLKGISSQNITLVAFERLQKSYLASAFSNENFNLDRNLYFANSNDKIFSNYSFAILSMNGIHALRPHNRKFYYNAFNSEFEPIYYDGMVNFSSNLNVKDKYEIIESFFIKLPDENFIKQLLDTSDETEYLDDFLNRVKLNPKQARIFLKKSLENFINNQRILKLKIDTLSREKSHKTKSFHNLKYSYVEFQKLKNINQKLIQDISIDIDNKYYNIGLDTGEQIKLSDNEFSKIISKNTYKIDRIVYLTQSNLKNITEKKINKFKSQFGSIVTSNGINMKIDNDKKIIEFYQSNPTDWVLIHHANLNDWKILFNGLNNKYFLQDNSQRFNNFNLTGCLNIYKSKIDYSSFLIDGGMCEDSLNIISSSGKDISLNVKNALFDAIDFDFSNIIVKSLYVDSAGNDCLDLSGGVYEVLYALLQKCKDKGISVGEKSKFYGEIINIDKALIGVSIKDLSFGNILELRTNNSDLCIEVKQKKQEFGGGNFKLAKLKCDGIIEVDHNSVYSIKTNELS